MTRPRDCFVEEAFRVPVYYDKNGVKYFLKGIRILQVTMEFDTLTYEYDLIAEDGAKTIEWLKLNLPHINFRDPRREEVEGYARWVRSIEEAAVARYKREQGIG